MGESEEVLGKLMGWIGEESTIEPQILVITLLNFFKKFNFKIKHSRN